MGIGYLLSKTTDVPTKVPNTVHKSERPSMNTVYDSSYYPKTRVIEQQAGNKMFTKSLETRGNVIGSTYRENIDYTERNKTIKSNLAGVEIPSGEFTHNNMTPFFGSRMKQNVDPKANSSTLETFTGNYSGDIYVRKREQKPLFDPSHNVQNIYGNTENTDYLKDRLYQPRIRNNERPFEQVRVGPGLNAGYGYEPIGGFQQIDARDYAMPKNVDELRQGTNPKLSFEGRILPAKGSTQRGIVGTVNRNKDVFTFVENREGERNFTTTGAYTKAKERPEIELKDTVREATTREYMGDPFRAVAQKTAAQVKAPFRQPLEDFGFRNMDGEDIGKGLSYDYGKSSITPIFNERDLTTEKTYEGNITSLVKAIVAPLQDVFKPSRKEYIVQHARPYGQLQATFPEKITLKDPNDVARTTIKETLIHDTVDTGNLKGATKVVVYDPEDIARRTVRETTRSMETSVNLSGGKKSGKMPLVDKPGTTIRETTSKNDHTGHIESLEGRHGGYKSTEYDAKLTQKQFLSDEDYFGVAANGQEDGYKISPAEAPDTQKQFLSDIEHYGTAIAGENKKPISYEDILNATINELKEPTLVGREPTQESVKVASGADDVNLTYKKIVLDECNARDTQNIERVVAQQRPEVDECAVTKEKTQLDVSDRLDINILSSLENNPYALKPLNEM
jgi:hypothetical protein